MLSVSYLTRCQGAIMAIGKPGQGDSVTDE